MGALGAGRAAALAALGLALACASAPPPATYHVVRPGENLYRISRHYGVPVELIQRANGIRDPSRLQVGQRLGIPRTGRSQPDRSLTPDGVDRADPRVARRAPPPGDRATALREADLRFGWPVSGRLNSRFGWRRGRRHEGIDIKARAGTPVHAAEAGRVVFSGRLGDYGRVVIVKHARRYSTVYAHNSRNHVEKGQFVEKGDRIASVGSSGNASGPHLHFELRRDRVAQDPLAYLPEGALTARR